MLSLSAPERVGPRPAAMADCEGSLHRRTMRLLAAHLLRAITTAGIALAALISLLTVVGIGVVVLGDHEAPGWGVEEILPAWLGSVALLLAVSRLAYLVLASIVEVAPDDRQPPER